MPQFDLQSNPENEDDNHQAIPLSMLGDGSPTSPSDERDMSPPSPVDSTSVPDSNVEAVANALAALLNTNTWSEMRVILEREQALLLTDMAEQMLTMLIRDAQQSTNPYERLRADYFTLHLMVLHVASLKGLPAAWIAFEAALQEIEEYQGGRAEEQSLALTYEEAERAADDPTFLAEKLNLALDDPNIPTIQEQLRSALVRDKQSLSREQKEDGIATLKDDTSLLTSTDPTERVPQKPLGTLLKWVSTLTHHESRRFLEAHLELVDPSLDAVLKGMIAHRQAYISDIQQATGNKPRQIEEEIQALHDRMDLLREAYTRGRTVAAIRAAYVNAFGGFALDLPPWLEDALDRIVGIRQTGKSNQAEVTQAKAALLRAAIARAQRASELAQETLAELNCFLWEVLNDVLGMNRDHAQEEGIACLRAALQIYAFDCYPRQFAKVQLNLGNAYSSRVIGERRANLEEAIIYLSRALQVFTLDISPVNYARVQLNLGNAYVQRIEGERRANLEEAITCFFRALQVFTLDAFPEQYAQTQRHLGMTYIERIEGERRANLEEAITRYTHTLQVFPLDAFPMDNARAHCNLGIAYLQRIEGERRANLEEGITHLALASQLFTLDTFPMDFARTYYNLGNAYLEREDDQTDREEAISCFTQVLRVYTLDAFPTAYAEIQFKLGNIYVQRIEEDRRTNAEKAIACYTHALQVYTLADFPESYAITQSNLGYAYSQRILGERRTNLEAAITCYTHALQVFTFDTFPMDYARTQYYLGMAYSQRIMGMWRTNLEEAITCSSRALEFYTPDTALQEYAAVQTSLGGAYLERIEGNRLANLKEAFACFKRALQVFTLDAFPKDYAVTQINLGSAYRDWIVGEPRLNLEEAIACFKRALQVYTLDAFPKDYALAQYQLGIIYVQRIEGDRQTNLEEVTACLKRALQVFTLDAFPQEYALAQLNLGTSYMEQIEGDRRASVEEAITCYQRALQVLTFDTSPQDYALAQLNLGYAYIERIAGEKRTNLEEAIVCLSHALDVYTLDAFPQGYAKAQHNLGYAYSKRIAGKESTNLEEAIACYQRTLQVYTYNNFPMYYAATQDNLGAAYSKRFTGDRQANLEEAIACYQRALQVFTLDAFPYRYARTQRNLGGTNALRIAGERHLNLEEAIACLSRALQVYTLDAFPMDYALTQFQLGNVYDEQIEGDRPLNLEEAIACYTSALQVFTLDAFPNEHRWTQHSLALAEAKRQNWMAVHNACSSALAAEDMLVVLGAGVIGRDAVLKEGHNAPVLDGFALTRLARISGAAVAIERGRARGLAESLALNAADPTNIRDRERRTRYEEVREAFIAAQVALNAPLRVDFDPVMLHADLTMHTALIDQKQRMADLARIATYHQAKAAFDSVVNEIRAAQDPADFLETTINPTTILRAAEQVGQGHALVYLTSTPWGGVAVAALSGNPAFQTIARFAALDLPNLNDELVSELIENKLSDGTNPVIGGFAHAQEGNGLGWVLRDWWGATFYSSAKALHNACVAVKNTSTLDMAAQKMLVIPVLLSLIIQPLSKLNRDDLRKLDATLSHLFLQYELERCLPVLTDVALRPLVAWLQEQGATSVTLIPCGGLAAFPLLSAEMTPGQTVGDLLATTVAPSARALLHNGHHVLRRSGIYTLGDPHPTGQELRWGEAEAYTLAILARHLGFSAEVRVHYNATRSWLVEALEKGDIVDASCHGTFNIPEPLRSALALAQREELTLGDMLSYEVDLRGLRLLILSACQTAILDLRGARDEVHSLAAGMLQAGARAVLASLWAVDDKATYLLMVRFAQEWFPRMQSEPPATALARAKLWLRTVTNRDLQTWRATSLPVPTVEERRRAGSEWPERDPWVEEERELIGAMKLAAVRGRGNRYDALDAESLVRMGARRQDDPDVRPYADPIYWAGFQITGW